VPRKISVDRREEILVVACDVLRERGFAKTRISDVAHRLGISAPLVVYHFGSKEALLAEAFAFASRAETAYVDDLAESSDSPVDRLDALLVAAVGPATRSSWALWIDSWGEALRSEVLRRTWRQLDDDWRRSLRCVIEDGMASGVFAGGDAAETASVLAALLDGLGVQVALAHGRRAASLEQARRVSAELLGVSLTPRPRRTRGEEPGPH
jgi:AcrR family transcriptional regulator